MVAAVNVMMSTHPKTLSKPDAKYDLVKFFLSLLVLAIHSELYPMVLYPWLRIAVPLFFVISSYFVFSKMHDAPADKQKQILKKFVARNLQLYLCWFVILLPATYYLRKNVFFTRDILSNVWELVKGFLFGSTFFASWFIMATVIGVLLVHLLCKWLRKDWLVFAVAAVAFVIVTLVSSYPSVLSGTALMTAVQKYSSVFGGITCSFPAALFWVFLGKLFAEQKLKFKSTAWLIVLIFVSGAALFAEWKFVISLNGSFNNDSYFLLAPLCTFLFLGVQKIKPMYWEPSVRFKRASTIIYVAHGSLLYPVSDIAARFLHIRTPLLSYVLTLSCCLFVYLVIELVIKKWPHKVLKMLY